MSDNRPVIDLNTALVNMFGPSSERPSAGTLELVVTLRKPDEFEALLLENKDLRRENDELRRANETMHDAISENLGLRSRLRGACKALEVAGVSSVPYKD